MRHKFGWDLPPGVTHRMIEEQAGAFEEEAIDEAYISPEVSEALSDRRKEQPVMTPEEKKELADRLARIIMAFFDKQTPSTNQEAIEILGIATMYYHSFVYAAGMSEIREKP